MPYIMQKGKQYGASHVVVPITQSQYDALTDEQQNNGQIYYIEDGVPNDKKAANVEYDNTTSGLTASNVQGAIDEVAGEIDGLSASDVAYGTSTVGSALDSVNTTFSDLKNDAYSLFISQALTTTETAYTTFASRKFSDYDLLIFTISSQSNGKDIRESNCTPVSIFSKTDTLIVFNVLHGTSASTPSSYQVSNCVIKYNSDTSINAYVGGSGVIKYLNVYGIKMNTRE